MIPLFLEPRGRGAGSRKSRRNKPSRLGRQLENRETRTQRARGLLGNLKLHEGTDLLRHPRREDGDRRAARARSGRRRRPLPPPPHPRPPPRLTRPPRAQTGMPEPLIIIGDAACDARDSARRAGYEPVELLADEALRRLRETPAEAPVLFTGAMENRPDVMQAIAGERKLLGSPASAVTAVRDPTALSNLPPFPGLKFPKIKPKIGVFERVVRKIIPGRRSARSTSSSRWPPSAAAASSPGAASRGCPAAAGCSRRSRARPCRPCTRAARAGRRCSLA